MFLIFFLIFFDILLYFGCWYMVNKVLVKAVFYFVSSSLMCIDFIWYKQMLRQLWACKGERILNQPGSWMLCVYKLLLFLTIVREIYRRTDGKYRNLQPNSISMSKGDNSLPTFHLPKPIVSYIPCIAINPYPAPLTLTNILFY